MEADIFTSCRIRRAQLFGRDDGNVPPPLVDGMDNVEDLHGDLSGRLGLPGFDYPRSVLSR